VVCTRDESIKKNGQDRVILAIWRVCHVRIGSRCSSACRSAQKK